MEKLNGHHHATSPSQRRFVKVAPPTVHAGLGNALREAYRLDPELRSLKDFDDLLSRLDL